MIGGKVREMSGICEGRVIDLIASGYNRDVLPYAWLALISGLAGFGIRIDEPGEIHPRFRQDSSLSATESVVEEVRSNLQEYWSCLR